MTRKIMNDSGLIAAVDYLEGQKIENCREERNFEFAAFSNKPDSNTAYIEKHQLSFIFIPWL